MSGGAVTIIGGGISGMTAALLLSKRGWKARIIEPRGNPSSKRSFPVVCAKPVLDFWTRELPELLERLRGQGAREISIASIVRERFPAFTGDTRDQSTVFFCASHGLLYDALSDLLQKWSVEKVTSTVTGLCLDKGRVTGVKTGTTVWESALVLDCSGMGSQRKLWLREAGVSGDEMQDYGPSQLSLVQTYQAKEPLGFRLCTGLEIHGGIYPMEKERFAISFIIREALVSSPEQTFMQACKGLGGVPEDATALSELQVTRGLRNRASNYYANATEILPGFYPLGDSVLFGNPIYGQGISFFLLQMQGLLEALGNGQTPYSGLRRSFEEAQRIWNNGTMSDRADGPLQSLGDILLKVSKFYYQRAIIPQLHSDPKLLRAFMYHYQQMLPAWRIAGFRQHLRGIAIFMGRKK